VQNYQSPLDRVDTLIMRVASAVWRSRVICCSRCCRSRAGVVPSSMLYLQVDIHEGHLMTLESIPPPHLRMRHVVNSDVFLTRPSPTRALYLNSEFSSLL
jgi:hypothetical protein